jgi:hypothetical protein
MAKFRAESPWTRRRWKPSDASEVLAALERSGLSVGRFAAQHGLDPNRVHKWRRRLGVKASGAERPLRFREVALSRRDALGHDRLDGFEVVLPSGHVVRVGRSFDAKALRSLLRLVSELGS